MTLSKPWKIVLGTLGTLLLVLVAIVIFILTFDWNRARPYINRKVSESTGRDFAIQGDLQVHFRQGLKTEPGWRRYVPRPVIDARDVRMSNPDWAKVGPQMASAERIHISLHALPLLHKQVVLTDLQLTAPVIGLERRADGSNSWTLKDNGPSEWDVEIQRLAFADGKLRYLDNGIGLDLKAEAESIAAGDAAAEVPANATPTGKAGSAAAGASTAASGNTAAGAGANASANASAGAVAAASAPASAGASANASASKTAATHDAAQAQGVQKYGIQFKLSGSYNKAPVTGGGKAGAVLSLQDEHTQYPVVAQADIGGNKIAVDGILTDPRSLSGINLQLKLAGASMSNLYPLTGVLLPATPAYETHGRLIGKKDGGKDGGTWNWTYQKFTGKVGGSDLAGTLEYLPRKPRPLLRGAVTSQQLRLADLGPAVGADSNQQKQARGQAPVQPGGKALPVEQFDTSKWGALDADVKFTGKRLVHSSDIPLRDIVAEIHMKNKVLSLTPLNFGMAGGSMTSNISLDGSKKSIDAQLKLAARHLKIRELFPKLQSMQASFGEVNGDAALTGHGNSVSAMLASSNGELGAVVTEGSVSKFILELAGLNVANAVFVKLFGDKQIQLNCVASEFAVTNGRAGVRRFVVDTTDAVIDVTGDIDLANERLNLDVKPQTKGTRIFSLRTPLYAKGTFTNPDVGPHKGPLALKAGAAVALAAVSPLAAVLPLVNLGKVADTDCAGAIAAATATRKAPKSEATAAPAKPVTEAEVRKAERSKKD